MIGRLVEQQDIGIVEERDGQSSARLLTAAEGGERLLKLVTAKAKPGERLLDCVLDLQATGMLIPCL